ncbi:MAG: hypothetical protein RJB66_1055 [Pseudomonadota bacterium]|jgi:AmiR/NasT family two-component response regulator
MLRILLAIEDVNQLNSIKLILLKLGCIIESISVELGVRDQLISFRPDVVITAGTGKKINPQNVSLRVRETGSTMSVILLLGKGLKINLQQLAENKFDAFIESPVEPMRLVSTLNQLVKKENFPDLVEKFVKLSSSSSAQEIEKNILVTGAKPSEGNEKVSVFGGKFGTSVDPQARSRAYKELTKDIKIPAKSSITKQEALKKVAKMQEDWDQGKLDELDEEKRRFVNELFRKK